MQAEALTLDEAGNHTRRSIIRKIYLYLAIIAGVVGGMIAAVQLISLILEALLGTTPGGFRDDLLNSLQMLILFGGLLTYHRQILRRDGLIRTEIVSKKADRLDVLLFDVENGTLFSQLASLMDTDEAAINLILQNPAKDIPAADVAILPEALAFNPPQILKDWLRDFNGSKLIVADESNNWCRVKNPRQIAKSLHQLAEGEEIELKEKSSGWMFAVYILAGMMALQILFILLMIVIEGY